MSGGSNAFKTPFNVHYLRPKAFYIHIYIHIHLYPHRTCYCVENVSLVVSTVPETEPDLHPASGEISNTHVEQCALNNVGRFLCFIAVCSQCERQCSGRSVATL